MQKNVFQIIKDAYLRAEKRIFFLDYDGTVVPFSINPENALPEDKIINLITNLTVVKENSVVIISGRDCEFLEAVFAEMKVTLVAEHGLFIRRPGSSWITTSHLHNEWKSAVRIVLEKFRQRFSGSMIEEKKGSLAWHYRSSDVFPDSISLSKLRSDLFKILSKYELEILNGKCVIEVKGKAVNKGSAALSLIRNHWHDFILAAGDDVTDEYIFQALPKDAFSIKVGDGETAAKFCCLSISELEDVLRFIINQDHISQ
ncbi:MAG: trehalose-phosphatase [Alphaproteobacteria bacterium]|nr:trehalose-phosphatase [Alphaproteobacteria bacterium]